ncbi:ADP-ribosylglycohydrolase family protein [Actinomadura barringtoniae]|uniref:ADP-ribosylglycohydrolase family protein n=1 Tax=Actinomadura barringtoniae TaxID=1427535 RepID=A0A939P7B4_9ACTN|nr:ADP-ribosylglycohydrolase family protein [Actinomadura barringtoniae]MBO2447057.1 ADP-ribosylglycohydrolase family protein [Actinomadura barringtoniae]
MAIDRLERALTSLRGLAIGDALGSQFFVPANRPLLDERKDPPGPWQWTDDTEMACAVVLHLAAGGTPVDQDRLVALFAEHHDFDRGYGPSTGRFLRLVREGGDWRALLGDLFDGQGSWGNGAAMRVAPLGAYHAGSLRQAALDAERSAEVTHTHPEGVAGAVAVAVAASAIASGRRAPGEIIDAVLERVEPGLVHDGVRQARRLLTLSDPRAVAEELGNGRKVSAQDTVPFTIWAAVKHLDDFEAAIWATAQAGGDVDTTCAIVGGMVAAGMEPHALPRWWNRKCEDLPSWLAFLPPARPGTATERDWKTKPMRSPEPLPAPERVWAPYEWEAIRRGLVPAEMEEKWFAYVEADRLHFHRSWTGYKIFEARFRSVPGGWQIADASVERDKAIYKSDDDGAAESARLHGMIDRLLLGYWG